MDPKTPKVLYLTPFNFESPHHDSEFDSLVQKQFENLPNVEIVADHVERFEWTEENYESQQEKALLSAIKNAENQRFDVVINACFYDPSLDAVRSQSTLPVVGPLQLCVSLASQYGKKFHALTDIQEAENVIFDLISGYCAGDECLGVSAINIDGDTILQDTFAAAKVVDEHIQKIAAEGKADSVVIACTIVSAAYEEHRSSFPDRGIPVMNSNLTAILNASLLALG